MQAETSEVQGLSLAGGVPGRVTLGVSGEGSYLLSFGSWQPDKAWWASWPLGEEEAGQEGQLQDATPRGQTRRRTLTGRPLGPLSPDAPLSPFAPSKPWKEGSRSGEGTDSRTGEHMAVLGRRLLLVLLWGHWSGRAWHTCPSSPTWDRVPVMLGPRAARRRREEQSHEPQGPAPIFF